MHLPLSERLTTAVRLERLIDETLDLIAQEGKSFDYAKGRFVGRFVTGGYWWVGQRQRRWKGVFSPIRPTGRRTRRWARFLVGMLGAEFYRGTGNTPTRGSTNGSVSKFQVFASLFLTAFKIYDEEGLIREYLKERRKSNP